jgi:hypothetical protein
MENVKRSGCANFLFRRRFHAMWNNAKLYITNMPTNSMWNNVYMPNIQMRPMCKILRLYGIHLTQSVSELMEIKHTNGSTNKGHNFPSPVLARLFIYRVNHLNKITRNAFRNFLFLINDIQMNFYSSILKMKTASSQSAPWQLQLSQSLCKRKMAHACAHTHTRDSECCWLRWIRSKTWDMPGTIVETTANYSARQRCSQP